MTQDNTKDPSLNEVLMPVQMTDEMRDAANVIVLDRGKLFQIYKALRESAPVAAPVPEIHNDGVRDDTPGLQARVNAAPAPEARPHVLTWKHAANEWADTAYNGLQHIRNIKDGITTAESALENMTKCCAYAHEVADSVREIDAAVAPVPEAKKWPRAAHIEKSGDYFSVKQVQDIIAADRATRAAPAVKHEASEVPVTRWVHRCTALDKQYWTSAALDAMQAEIDDLRTYIARQSAPPIAVHGSIDSTPVAAPTKEAE